MNLYRPPNTIGTVADFGCPLLGREREFARDEHSVADGAAVPDARTDSTCSNYLGCLSIF